MAASRRASPAAARPQGTPRAPRARGRRRRLSLWRRVLLALPRPRVRGRRDRTAELEAELRGLRLAVAALRAELREMQLRPLVAAEVVEPPSVTLLLPLAWAALEAGVPVGAEVPVDFGPDTAPTLIDLRDLPEAPLLDPRVAREAAELDDLMGREALDTPSVGAHRKSA